MMFLQSPVFCPGYGEYVPLNDCLVHRHSWNEGEFLPPVAGSSPWETADMRETSRKKTQGRGDDEREVALLTRVADGDRAALTQLYERYHSRLLRFIYRLTGDLEAAQEGVNDVMLVVWNSAANFGGRSRASTWIMGIAYRKAMKLSAGLRRWKTRFKAADWHDVVEPAVGHEGLTDELITQELIFRALRRLPPKQRAVVELTYLFGYSYEEIAEIVKCPENTVKTRMFHARARLKELLPTLGQHSGSG
jgi:RNA polymerase sigma-70 factor (ECF subfamily)